MGGGAPRGGGEGARLRGFGLVPGPSSNKILGAPLLLGGSTQVFSSTNMLRMVQVIERISPLHIILTSERGGSGQNLCRYVPIASPRYSRQAHFFFFRK